MDSPRRVDPGASWGILVRRFRDRLPNEPEIVKLVSKKPGAVHAVFDGKNSIRAGMPIKLGWADLLIEDPSLDHRTLLDHVKTHIEHAY